MEYGNKTFLKFVRTYVSQMPPIRKERLIQIDFQTVSIIRKTVKLVRLRLTLTSGLISELLIHLSSTFTLPLPFVSPSNFWLESGQPDSGLFESRSAAGIEDDGSATSDDTEP